VGQHLTVPGFHRLIMVAAILVALGGVLGLVGIRNPPADVGCEDCPGGALAGASAHQLPATPGPADAVPAPATA
jgi:hypothetical protein